MNLKLFSILILLIIFGATKQLHGLVQISVSGNWQETIDSTDLIPGPEPQLSSTYTSSDNAVTIDIDANAKERWLVYVSKTDSNWDPRMHLFLRRTSSGIGNGRIFGGTSFKEITSSDQRFIFGKKARANIAVQFQLTGISLQIPPDAYNTTITYTITEK